jgi:hypothetical protein
MFVRPAIDGGDIAFVLVVVAWEYTALLKYLEFRSALTGGPLLFESSTTPRWRTRPVKWTGA